MVAEVMGRVSGFHRAGDVAVLPGHRRGRLSGRLYPAIVPWPGSRVEGLLYRGLEPGQFEALDAFEGAMYRRVAVNVVVGADRFSAETYLLRKSWSHLLGDGDWSLQRFVSEDLREFLAEYPGFVPATSSDVVDDQRH